MSRLRAEGLAIRVNHITTQLTSALEARNGGVSHRQHNSSNSRVHDTNVDAQDNFYENVDVLQDIPYVNVNARADGAHSIAANVGSTLNRTVWEEEEERQQETPTTPEEAEAGDLSSPSVEQDKFQIPQREWNGKLIKLVRSIAIITLFFAVLASATLSKVSFVAIAAKMYDAVANGESNRRQWSVTFTQIVVVLMIPQLITFVRMFVGIIGKKQSVYPLPSIGALIVVSMYVYMYMVRQVHGAA